MHKALPHLVGLLIIEWITIHSAKKYPNHLGAAWVHQVQVPHGIAASICLIDFSKCGVISQIFVTCLLAYSTLASFSIVYTPLLNEMFLFYQNVEEADRPQAGFYIRSGITIVLKNSIIKDGTVIQKRSVSYMDLVVAGSELGWLKTWSSMRFIFVNETSEEGKQEEYPASKPDWNG